MTRPDLRIGDREREAALSALGEHYAAGRITKEEYDERSAAIWAARTNAQLWPVFSDLPGPHQSWRSTSRTASQPPSWTPSVQPRERRRRGPKFPVLPLLLVIVGIAMVTDVWPVLIIVGVLWWAGAFHWMSRTCQQGHRRHGHRPA